MVKNMTEMPINHVRTHEDLIEWSRNYARQVVAETDLDIDFDYVIGWEVTTRAKRRAAAVESMNHRNLSVGRPVTADYLRDLGTPDSDTYSDYREVKVILTWDAFQAFSEAEWKRTIRHELIHIEQMQEYGASNHGARFKRRASDLDTEPSCPKFTTGKYILICTGCEEIIGERHRRSKTVKQPEKYRSKCCNAVLESKKNPNYD